MFPALSHFLDLGLLLLRLMVGLVFVTSGYSHLKDPEARSKSIGMPKGFTIFLGLAEVAGALGVGGRSAHSIGCLGANSHHAGRDPEEDIRLAYRVLGREVGGLALRLDLRAD